MRDEKTIPPDWRLIKLAERQHWHADVQAQTTGIWGVYAYDRSSHTHLCEATPSYCLWYVGTDYAEVDGLTDEQRSTLNETIVCADNEPTTYMHVRDVERLVAAHPERGRETKLDLSPADYDDEQAYLHAAIDEITEGWNTGALLY